MTVKKYGKQGFFNPPDSDDDGSYKLSIRPHNSQPERPSIYFQLRDCSNYIVLDLDTYGTNDKPKELKEAKKRLKKIRKMRRVIDEFLSKAEDAMAKYVEWLETDE